MTESEEMLLENLFNFPNPFGDRTWFNIEHNRPDMFLKTSLMIYNMSGALVKKMDRDIFSPGYRLDPIEWDGESSNGSPLASGVYLYKVVLTTMDGETAISTGKLVISR